MGKFQRIRTQYCNWKALIQLRSLLCYFTPVSGRKSTIMETFSTLNLVTGKTDKEIAKWHILGLNIKNNYCTELEN